MCGCCDYIEAVGGVPGDPKLIRQYQFTQRQRAHELIARQICYLTYVEPDERIGAVEYGYSTGLTSADHPELILFGLPPKTTANILNAISDRVFAGEQFVDEDATYELVHPSGSRLPFKTFVVPEPDDNLVFAVDYYGHTIAALQVVFPDQDGVWPWEPGCRLDPAMTPMPGHYPPSPV